MNSVQDGARFSCMNDNNPGAEMLMRHNREWVHYMLQMPVVPGEDLRAYCARQRALLGLSTKVVKQMLNVSVMLRRMPKLADLAIELGHLNLQRLNSLENQLSAVSDEAIVEVEKRITDYLTPKVHDEALPQARTISSFARKVVNELEPEATVATRDHTTPKAQMRVGDNAQFHLSATFNSVDGALVNKALVARAGKHATPEQLQEALTSLILDKVSAHVHLYAFKGLDDEKIHLSGTGELTDEEKEKLMELVGSLKEVDGSESTAAYAPPKALVVYVKARDGVCRFPSCTVDASECQIDHVVPFGEGGTTTTDNTQCLCQNHHALKTEGIVFVEMNAAGECTWTLNDGTIHTTFPQGVWRNTPARTAEAQKRSVRGHTIAHDQRRRRQRGLGSGASAGSGPGAGSGADPQAGQD